MGYLHSFVVDNKQHIYNGWLLLQKYWIIYLILLIAYLAIYAYRIRSKYKKRGYF